MKYVLKAGCEKLREIRKFNSDAGGLVVASSVEHAYQLLSILENELAQTATIVTYHDQDALSKIALYRQGTTEWIVSVGMISEGTDIPRLQVCCHLSTVKTELYFRQVLGRVLRVNESKNQDAWLFTMAIDELTLFSNRLAEELPEDYKILQQQSDDWSLPGSRATSTSPDFMQRNCISKSGDVDLKMDFGEINISGYVISEPTNQLIMSSLYQQVIEAFLFSDI